MSADSSAARRAAIDGERLGRAVEDRRRLAVENGLLRAAFREASDSLGQISTLVGRHELGAVQAVEELLDERDDARALATERLGVIDGLAEIAAAPAAPTILAAEFEDTVIEMLEQAMVGADTHHRAAIARHLLHELQGRTLPTGIDRPGARSGAEGQR
jgi:hypothetical protein